MLQSLSISDYKQSPQSIFNSLQSQAVIKSVNLNSGFKDSALKSSASKRLHSECNSELQVSASSENSKMRSYSLQSNRPTITRNLAINQSHIDTVTKKSEAKEGKFVSLNPNEYISDFTQKEQVTNLQNKVTILIDENQKLILINEQLMQELEKAKIVYETNNQTVLLQSLQRETQSLQQTVLQYKKINNQQSQQILELQHILNEREEITQQSQNNANRLLKEQFTQLSTKYLLKCFELERVSQLSYQDKVKVLLKENENLNQMLQQRIDEYVTLQQQYKMQNEQILHLEQEINYMQQQLTDQNYAMTKKNQDQVHLLAEVNRQYEMKNEENRKLAEQLMQSEQKWRQRCIDFEKDMKQSYSNKLNSEIKQQVKHFNDECQRTLQGYVQTIAVMQGQMQILQKQNEQLHRTNSQNTNAKEWQHEKQLYYEIIQELQQKVSEQTNLLAKIYSSNQSSKYDSLGIQEQLIRLEEGKRFNDKMHQKCQEIVSKRMYF